VITADTAVSYYFFFYCGWGIMAFNHGVLGGIIWGGETG